MAAANEDKLGWGPIGRKNEPSAELIDIKAIVAQVSNQLNTLNEGPQAELFQLWTNEFILSYYTSEYKLGVATREAMMADDRWVRLRSRVTAIWARAPSLRP